MYSIPCIPFQLLASLGRTIGSEAANVSAPVDDSTINVSSSVVKGKTKMSRRIPMWLWVVIAKSLGIKLHAKDNPAVASVLHLLTIGAGAGVH